LIYVEARHGRVHYGKQPRGKAERQLHSVLGALNLAKKPASEKEASDNSRPDGDVAISG